jgi:hypothetical protein
MNHFLFSIEAIVAFSEDPLVSCSRCVLWHHEKAPHLDSVQKVEAMTFPFYKANRWAYFHSPRVYQDFLKYGLG